MPDFLNAMRAWSNNPVPSALASATKPYAPIAGFTTGLGEYGVDKPMPSLAAPAAYPMENYDALGPVMPPDWAAQTATDAVAAARPDFWSLDSLLGKKMADGTVLPGWGSTALGVGQGLMSGFLGMQQYGLMKDQLAESKRQYDQNYAAQRTTTNARLEDRQRARVASNAGAYQSVGDYMNQYGVK